MNTKKAAEAYRTLSVGYAELADAYMDDAIDTGPVGTAPRPGAASPAAAPAELSPFDEPFSATDLAEWRDKVQDKNQAQREAQQDQPKPSSTSHREEFGLPIGQPEGALAVCPKHRIPYTEGQYGPYCKQQTDDPAWGKKKGDAMWCRITPKNADQYLRNLAAAG